MKQIIRSFIQVMVLCFLFLGLQQEQAFAQFPCGGQILNACNCEGPGVLVADSDPCTFNSAEQQIFLLVDAANAIITTDADDQTIVDISSTGAFFNVQEGDYVLYSLVYNTSDAILIQTLTGLNDPILALQSLGIESPAGTWTNTDPTFTLTATDLATVNGPACNCATYSIGNYIWMDLNSNGQQDSNENGIAGVTVYLYADADGDGVPDSTTPIGTAMTNANGYYFFPTVAGGDYVMQVDLGTLPGTAPDGTTINWTPTGQNAGSDFSDSDFNNNGYTASFSVNDGEVDLSFDAGFTPSLMSLSTELITFEGKVMPTGNELAWVTASEINNDYFSIMSSKDGIDFNSVGTVKGAGNSSTRKNYLFLDKTASVGINYYQLTDTDFSGKTAIVSKTIALTRELAGFTLAEIRPVPAVDFVNIDFLSNGMKDIGVKVFSSSGKMMINQVAAAAKGENSLKLNIKNYPVGVYFITITDGKDKLVAKFLKN